jgi:hypothetical protein
MLKLTFLRNLFLFFPLGFVVKDFFPSWEPITISGRLISLENTRPGISEEKEQENGFLESTFHCHNIDERGG